MGATTGMGVERRLLLWDAWTARVGLVGGAAWMALVLALALVFAPPQLAGQLAWFGVLGVVAIAPASIFVLRLRVTVRVRATRAGLQIVRERRSPPAEGLLPWSDIALTWTPREDGDNLAVDRVGHSRLVLSAAGDRELVLLRSDIEEHGVHIQVR